MRATKEYVERKFDEFNRQMFGGRLPRIPVELSDAKTFLGQCVYRRRRKRNGTVEKYDFRLRINTRIDLPEQQIEDTIIHEMIHYYIGVFQLRDTSAHGQLFRRIMNQINEKFHRHVAITFKGDKQQNEQFIDKRPRWHVVARVELADGRIAVKVLPRVVRSILRFYNMIMGSKEVKSVNLFMSNDVFFNRYPNSSSPRVHFIDDEELFQHLRGAERMGCDGRTITRGL